MRKPTEKILIAQSEGDFEPSRSDLKTLFEEYNQALFTNPDVAYFTKDTNLDGLDPKHTTIVIPGGQAMMMSLNLPVKNEVLEKLFTTGSNGVFICAGGYLAAREMRVGNKNNGLVTLSPPILDFSLGILSNFTAIGPFYPTDIYDKDTKYSAHSVQIKSSIYTLNARQIYWEGCGFVPNKLSNSLVEKEFEVVATYGDKDTYFFNNHENYDNLAAIVRKKPSGASGGFFASGIHIEAGVQNSKLLNEAKGTNRYLKNTASFFNSKQALDEVLPILSESISRKP
ncbi:Uncharacterized conserved protein [Legionella beliardensis]|uniref:Uncharacterized conserved protein n=1 Tax=Legionella beliardensis TaxID=91822 RepID=A0A378I439_9GAMM|nr:BPL-N domain-containing protein [Legionella beliardensis]STX29461.1 Uncharacterized conserved protein [Legionella beliardensis]